jgi:hypothetical protein
MDAMTGTTILWRRLDVEGHDCCRMAQADDGWVFDGKAVFVEGGDAVALDYRFSCDGRWRTKRAEISGWIGTRDTRLTVERGPAGDWRLNGVTQDVPGDLVDVDLGFTPATNILPIRRLQLAVGDEARAPAVYLAFPELRLQVLEQTYRRIDETRYAYQGLTYEGVLDVSPEGFVLNYPGLWTATTTVAGNR